MRINRECAEKIYSILVTCGAIVAMPSNRDFLDEVISEWYKCGKNHFVDALVNGATEYRFCGELGFGGKFYLDSDRWFVSSYSEDMTPKRKDIITLTNALLKELFDKMNHPNGKKFMLTMTPECDAEFQRVCEDSGLDMAEVLRHSFTLFRMYLDAVKNGQELCILDPKNVTQRTVIQFPLKK